MYCVNYIWKTAGKIMQIQKKDKNNKIIIKGLYYIYARKNNNNFLFEVRGGSLTFLVYM